MFPTRRPAAIVLFVWTVAAIGSPSSAQISDNMTLLGSLQEYGQYSDSWGYTDPTGREYAIVGTVAGTTIVNVTNPATSYETGFIPGPASTWRDMKTYDRYAYIVSEGGGGMQIVDLNDPENPQPLTSYLGFTTAHNIYIEEATARAYVCGANNARGFHVIDLTNPTQPQALGSYTTTYVHDLYVRDNIATIAEIYEGTFSILDVTNPANPVLLAGPISYPGSFTHNAWLTGNGDYLLTSDEVVGARVRIWDVRNLAGISQVGSYQAPVADSIVHNVIVRGNLAYISYYSEGVRVIDVSDPTLPEEIGYYDTWTGPSGGYNGAWGVYPFFPSGNIVVSDIESGLFVLSLDSGGPITGIGEEGDLPERARVSPLESYPNPFNPSTRLRFELFTPGLARLAVHDLRGRKIVDLIDGELAAGVHTVSWDGRDAAGQVVASGVYMAALNAGGEQRRLKLVLTK
jgi:choice-of-anchor B domain-containing protein